MFKFLYPEDKTERKRLEYIMEMLRTLGSLCTVITMILNVTLFVYQVRIVTAQVKHLNRVEVLK